MTSFTWKIANLQRNIIDGKVQDVHYIVNAYDGTNSLSVGGSVYFDGELVIPFDDLSEELVLGWVKERLGEEKVANIENTLDSQLKTKTAKNNVSGVPW